VVQTKRHHRESTPWIITRPSKRTSQHPAIDLKSINSKAKLFTATPWRTRKRWATRLTSRYSSSHTVDISIFSPTRRGQSRRIAEQNSWSFSQKTTSITNPSRQNSTHQPVEFAADFRLSSELCGKVVMPGSYSRRG